MNKKFYALATAFLLLFLTIVLRMSLPTFDEGGDVLSADINHPGHGVEIFPIEHASMILEHNGLSIYIDPTGGFESYMEHNEADLILITDIHGDHLSIPTLKDITLPNTRILAPQAVIDKLPEDMQAHAALISNGETVETMGVEIEAVAMYNLREEAQKFHPKGRGNGYVLTLGDERVYISGDTEDIPEMRALKNIDIAFVCMNLPYTMPVERAASAVLEFKPRKVYPYHYRGKPDYSDVNRFKDLVEQGDPSIEVVQLDWYPNKSE